ncbi:MAG: metallophosphoesterase [Chthoniobacterales bacterium]
MRISRRAFLRTTIGAAVGAGVVSPALAEPWRVAVEKITVRLRRLPPAFAGFKIVQLSDLHYRPYTTLRQIAHVVDLTNRLQPDLVVITGDFVTEGHEHIDELTPILMKLQARHGITGVLGNHDQASGANAITAALRQAGIEMLRNQGRALTHEGASIYLAGVDSICGGDGAYPHLNDALVGRPFDQTTILLAHEPDYADRIPISSGISLQLSGHSHGGQICLPLVGALVLPDWGKKYWKGLRQLKQTQLYTNRGIGTIGVPMRVGSLPEITEITLAPTQAS